MSHLTNFEVFLLLSVIKVAVVLVITLMCVAYTVLLERKLLGRMQNRWGPSRVGPFGLLQPLVDGAKLFLKEDLMPTGCGAAALSVGAVDCAGMRAGVGGSGSVRRGHACEGRGHVRDGQCEYWPAGDSRDYFDRRIWDCAVGVVVEQQVFAAWIAALDCASGQL